jgi:hypothetical protein
VKNKFLQNVFGQLLETIWRAAQLTVPADGGNERRNESQRDVLQ